LIQFISVNEITQITAQDCNIIRGHKKSLMHVTNCLKSTLTSKSQLLP